MHLEVQVFFSLCSELSIESDQLEFLCEKLCPKFSTCIFLFKFPQSPVQWIKVPLAHYIKGYVGSARLTPGDVDLDHLIMVEPVRWLHCSVTIFPFSYSIH